MPDFEGKHYIPLETYYMFHTFFGNFLKPEIAFSNKQCKVNSLLAAIIYWFSKKNLIQGLQDQILNFLPLVNLNLKHPVKDRGDEANYQIPCVYKNHHPF